MKSKPVIISTKDGSDSLFVQELNETYHSIHGAIAESRHVFIANGLEKVQAKESHLSVLEVGFGTGLNALLAALWAMKNQVLIDYHSLEKYPVGLELIERLNYGAALKAEALFTHLHQAKWNEKIEINNYFNVNKSKADLTAPIDLKEYDLIFFDAFAPNKQAELWTEPIFARLYDTLLPRGLLTTYCAQGAVKRTLKSVGFTVESCPGPPGKREMTLAWKY